METEMETGPLERRQMMTLPKQDFEDMLERAAVLAFPQHSALSPQHSSDIRELRNLLDAFNEAKKTAGLTIIKMVVTGLVMAILTGTLIKLKLFGGAQ
jgi:hypothetical protein